LNLPARLNLPGGFHRIIECDVAVAVAVAVFALVWAKTEESPNCAVRKDRWATVLDNLKAAQADGKCNRKIPPFDAHGFSRGLRTVRVKWCGKSAPRAG
jgi:hypothetical protein